MQGACSEDKGLQILVMDAVDFARSFDANIAEHPLHVYYTALPLHPTGSIICRTFHSELLFFDRGGLKYLLRMNADLKRNFSNMSISAPPPDTNILPEELANACRSWVDYVCAMAEDSSLVMEALDVFIRTHLLHWFEAMSIIKETKSIVPMLERAAAWLKVCCHLFLKVLIYLMCHTGARP